MARGYRTAALAARLVPGRVSPIGNGHPEGYAVSWDVLASIAFGVPNALAGAPEPVCRALARGKELWNTEQGTFTLGPGSTKPSIRNYKSFAKRPAWALPDC